MKLSTQITTGLLFATVLFGGCATGTRVQLQNFKPNTVIFEPSPGISQIRYRIVEAKTEEEGRILVSNNREFHVDFFRQSQDPYFGTEKWSRHCLANNQFEPITESADSVGFDAIATTDRELRVGACAEESQVVRYLVVFCKAARHYYEIVLAGDTAKKAFFECPNLVVLP